MLQDGSLVYTDGSPATRADIACNCGACRGTPCSPRTCGTTDQPPHGTATSTGGGSGGGSGGGIAKSSGGSKPAPTSRANPITCVASKLTSAMSRLGSTVASLLSGGKRVNAGSTLPGQAIPTATTPMSSNTFLLILVIFGGLLLVMSFGHKAAAD